MLFNIYLQFSQRKRTGMTVQLEEKWDKTELENVKRKTYIMPVAFVLLIDKPVRTPLRCIVLHVEELNQWWLNKVQVTAVDVLCRHEQIKHLVREIVETAKVVSSNDFETYGTKYFESCVIDYFESCGME